RLAEKTRRRYPDLEIVGSTVAGSGAAALLDRATENDLIVVGSRSRSTVRSILLGSVSTAVAAHAPCPVIVVRGEPQERAETQERGETREQGGPMPQAESHEAAEAHEARRQSGKAVGGRRVVVGIDGSETGRAAAAFAFDEAARRGLPLDVVYVWSLDPFSAPGLWAAQMPMDEYVRDSEQVVKDEIVEFRRRYPQVEVQVRVLYGRPSQVLAERSAGTALLV